MYGWNSGGAGMHSWLPPIQRWRSAPHLEQKFTSTRLLDLLSPQQGQWDVFGALALQLRHSDVA